MTSDELRDLEAEVDQNVGFEALRPIVPGKSKRIREGLSSGSVVLNDALSGSSFCAYVSGRIVEIYGAEQSGKTTLALHTITEAQKKDFPCAFIDAEHALDINYAQQIGVDLERLSISQPDCGEDALKIACAAIDAGYKLIVIDSVPALVPRSELEGEIGDAHMGKQARLMGQGLRMIVGRLSKHEAVLVFINQLRSKLGVVFGNPEDTPGGRALKFFASYRIEVRAPRGGAQKEKSLSEGTVETGIIVKVKVVKNKLYPPYRTALLKIDYGRGIDKVYDVVELLAAKHVFGSNGRARIGGKSYTQKTLMNAIRRDKNVRRAVKEELKQLYEENDNNS